MLYCIILKFALCKTENNFAQGKLCNITQSFLVYKVDISPAAIPRIAQMLHLNKLANQKKLFSVGEVLQTFRKVKDS
jgi:hypothetical protein